MSSLFDIAKYILEKTGEITTWKLQKLVYYSQAWSLVWDERSLFDEPFEAWANGPVVRSLFKAHQGLLNITADKINGDSLNLDKDTRETIDAVLDSYGNFSGRELSEIAHSERPWKEARAGIPAGEKSDNLINRDTMVDFYTGLLDENTENE